jgi:methylated-DNA-[protein]-cysteine S-methyltransferase
MQQYTLVSAPFGSVGLVISGQGLSNLLLLSQSPGRARRQMQTSFPQAQYQPHFLPSLEKQLKDYFSGLPLQLRAPLDLSSCRPFQKKVLQDCSQIDYGRTMTYGQLARQIGRPKAARAVGGALARNPVPLIVPCHRVIAGDGKLGGFSAEQGIRVKRWLLELEAANRNNTLNQ